MTLEGLLLLLALSLYLLDSALLLASNDWALEGLRGRRWRPRFGLQGWKLSGREPLLPNPLAPWRPLLRVRWRFEESAQAASGPMPVVPATSLALQINAGFLLLLIFVALPLALFGYPLLTLKISVAAAIYATCAFSAALLWRDRARLGLTGADCAKLGLECIACPPFAINIVRKLSLRSTPLPAGAALRLAADHAATARIAMLARLREQIDIESEGTPRMAQLQAVATELEAVA